MPKVAKNNLFIYLVILLIAFIILVLYQSMNQSVGTIQIHSAIVPSNSIGGVSTQYLPEVVVDTYGPPLRNDQPPIAHFRIEDSQNNRSEGGILNENLCKVYPPRNSTDERGPIIIESIIQKRELVPINIETRGIPREFTQVGILKTNTHTDNRILSLFGRQLMTGGDKWQYYTLSNMGVMPTRLPIRIGNKDAMYEYGVDRLYSGDTIIVDGFDDEYIVQIYEPRQYRYI